MAYTKKTTNKKTTTKAKPVEVEEVMTVEETTQVEEDAPVAEKVVVPEKKMKHNPSDGILCRSLTVGKLCIEGVNTRTVYRFMDYGAEVEIEYRDLASAVRGHLEYIFTPRFIIEDDLFINEFPELEKFYKEKFTLKELTDILYMNEKDMEDNISILPKGAKEQFINIVSTKISTGELDSVKKIKTLERILGVDFSLVAEIQ